MTGASRTAGSSGQPDGTRQPPLTEAQIIDFALRHVDGLPDYYWGGASGLAELGIVLEPDLRATAALVAGQPDEMTKQVADLALDKIAAAFPVDDE